MSSLQVSSDGSTYHVLSWCDDVMNMRVYMAFGKSTVKKSKSLEKPCNFMAPTNAKLASSQVEVSPWGGFPSPTISLIKATTSHNCLGCPVRVTCLGNWVPVPGSELCPLISVLSKVLERTFTSVFQAVWFPPSKRFNQEDFAPWYIWAICMAIFAN